MDVTLAHSIHNAFARLTQPIQGENKNNVIIGAVAATALGLVGFKLWMTGSSNEHHPNLSGKIVVITGGNTGIGYETAKEFALMGARVIILVRNEQKGQDAVAELKQSTGKSQIEYQLLRLDDLSSVRSSAQYLIQSLGGRKIDILVNNAGVMATPQGKTKEGYELQFGTNHLGHYALTVLLLNQDAITDGGRIITLSSNAHYKGIMEDLNFEKTPYNAWQAYSNSKLANVLFARELQERLFLKKSNIISVSLHPGAVRTELARHLGAMKVVFYPLSVFFKTPNQGAQTTLHCALSPDVFKHGGEYFDNCRQTKAHVATEENAPSRKLWELSERLTNISLD